MSTRNRSYHHAEARNHGSSSARGDDASTPGGPAMEERRISVSWMISEIQYAKYPFRRHFYRKVP
jgi:hypothetical protein